MLKIKLAIVENDEQYLNRFVNYLMLHYGEQFEIVQFTEYEFFEQYISNNTVHCIVAGVNFLKEHRIADNQIAIVLANSADISEKVQCKVALKYQNIENIINEIKLVSADQMGKSSLNGNASAMPIFLFENAIGGAGTTTVAIAFSRYLAYKGKRVLYLNMEQIGDVSCFFPQDGQGSLSEVIYQLKAQKGNIQLKIDGLTNLDSIGVNYILPCTKPIDVLSLAESDWKLLIDTLKNMNKFDYLIVDRDFGLTELDNTIRQSASKIIYVTNGKQIQEQKIRKVESVLTMYDEIKKQNILVKACKIINRCDVVGAGSLQEGQIPVVLGFQEIRRNDANMIAEDLAHKEGFSNLV